VQAVLVAVNTVSTTGLSTEGHRVPNCTM